MEKMARVEVLRNQAAALWRQAEKSLIQAKEKHEELQREEKEANALSEALRAFGK